MREVGSVPAVAFFSVVGALSQGQTLVRWDGTSFVEILQTGSNSAGVDLRGEDAGGTSGVVDPWSPFCGSFATSPLLVSVYAWDGAKYVDATGRYPSVLAEYAEGIRGALDAGGERSAKGLASGIRRLPGWPCTQGTLRR